MSDIPPFSSQPAYDALGTWEAWLLMVEAHNTLRYGFTRLPTPGKSIPVDVAQEAVATVQQRWQAEANVRDRKGAYTGAPHLTDLPIEAQLWLYEQLEIVRRKVAAARVIDYPYAQ